MRKITPEYHPKMAVCTPMRALPTEGVPGGSHLEPITIEWQRAMKALLPPIGWNIGEIRVDGYEIGEARSLAAGKALENKFVYLAFFDADTLPPPNALRLLVYHLDNNPEYDIAAGLYCLKGDPPVPLIWNQWGAGVFVDWTLGDVLKDGIVGCGTGCMVIRVSLFERLEQTEDKPWFKTAMGDMEVGGVQFTHGVSDDIWFCKRAVEEAGSKILVDTNVYCRHIDWKTGRQYQLRDDSLPVRRLAEKLGEST